MGNIYAENEKGSNIGGIVGYLSKDTMIDQCYNIVDLPGNGGGIAGIVQDNNVSITNSYNLGKCKSGIVNTCAGANWETIISLNIKNCYNLGEVSDSGIIGEQGIICKEITLNIENCYNAGQTKNAVIGKILKNDRTTTITNVSNTYYDGSKAEGVGAFTEGITEMSIQNNSELVDMLNENIKDDPTLKQWKLGEDGYPTFVQ